MTRTHPKDSDRPWVTPKFRREIARRQRAAALRKADRNMRDEEAARRQQAQLVLGEEN